MCAICSLQNVCKSNIQYFWVVMSGLGVITAPVKKERHLLQKLVEEKLLLKKETLSNDFWQGSA